MLTEHELTSGMKVLEARPEGRARRPGVVLLHERYGIDQHTKDLGEKLAADGFVALLPDMFHRFDGDREALRRGDVRAASPPAIERPTAAPYRCPSDRACFRIR